MTETFNWNHLNYLTSKEWRSVLNKLDFQEEHGIVINPKRSAILPGDELPFEKVKVAIIGQDPYPQHKYCTGRAFDIPANFTPAEFPGTLKNIIREYLDDLGYDGYPKSGSLWPWVDQGVLLWNAIPTCQEGISLSHDWEEYEPLTHEIVRRLGKKGVVFLFMGGVARRYVQYVDTKLSRVIETSHPSPRASQKSQHPFFGSRPFSTINIKLRELKYPPIDWRLK